MCFLRSMSEGAYRPGEVSRAEEGIGDWRGGCGGRGGEDGLNAGTGANATKEAEQTLGGRLRPYTDKDVARITPDQVRAAASRGSLTAPQMQQRLGEETLSNKGLLRRLLVVASIGATESRSGGASEGPSGAPGASPVEGGVSAGPPGASGVPPMAGRLEAVSPVLEPADVVYVLPTPHTYLPRHPGPFPPTSGN